VGDEREGRLRVRIDGEQPAGAVDGRGAVSTVPAMTRNAPMVAIGAGLAPQIVAERQAWVANDVG
jgi:hypothetical protein